MGGKGYGEVLPIVGWEYIVIALHDTENGKSLIDLPMRCYHAVALFPLRIWGGRRPKLASRAWMLDANGGYWGWSAKSYAWAIDKAEWDHQLMIASNLPSDKAAALRYSDLYREAHALRMKLEQVESLMVQAEIDALR